MEEGEDQATTTDSDQEEPAVEDTTPKKKLVKRPNVYPLSRIQKEYFGAKTLSRE